MQEVNLPREEYFIATKVTTNIGDPEGALRASLKRLQIEYVDLYLIHKPFNIDIEKAWASLELLRDQGIKTFST